MKLMAGVPENPKHAFRLLHPLERQDSTASLARILHRSELLEVSGMSRAGRIGINEPSLEDLAPTTAGVQLSQGSTGCR